MKITQHHCTFPLYLPRIFLLLKNWPSFIYNYTCRIRKPAQYIFRSGLHLVDDAGTLAGTIAVVFIRREYGRVKGFNTVLDVGANMGSFALYAAQENPTARIYSYEPETRNFQCLRKNVEVNRLEGRVATFERAVASTRSSREMSIGLSPLNSLVAPPVGGLRRTVDCSTLGDILENSQSESVDLLKMNCEGAEYEIMETAAPEHLNRLKRIRLEYHVLDSKTRNGDALRGLLIRRGFKIKRYTRYKNESGFIWAEHQ